jgi:hypothetical protein
MHAMQSGSVAGLCFMFGDASASRGLHPLMMHITRRALRNDCYRLCESSSHAMDVTSSTLHTLLSDWQSREAAVWPATLCRLQAG